MNKNIIIGILVILVVVGGGYYLIKNKPVEPTTYTPKTDDTTPPSSQTTNTTPPVPVPPLTIGTPSVETSADAGVTNSTALVNGQVNPMGLSTVYWFDYGESTSLGAKTTSQQVGSGFRALSSPAYVTGLKANTTYYYRLSANNNFGTISGSTYSFKTNNNPPTPGVAPVVRTNSAANISRTGASLNGTVSPKGFQTNYWFEYGTDSSLGNVTNQNNVASGNSTITVAISISGLSPLTKYYFRINAQNPYGTVNGATMNFTTKGPAGPSAPVVSAAAASNINSVNATLNGSVNPHGAETTYWFEYSTDSLLGTLIGSGTSHQTLVSSDNSVGVKANIKDLSRNTKYYYRLVSNNSYGTVKSDIMSFSTQK